jgi:hypothetical protein
MSELGKNEIKKIDIDSLKDGIPVMTEGLFGIHKESCIVCFGSNGHSSGVKMELLFDNDKKDVCKILYSGKFTKRLLKSYSDNNKTTDYAACAIALLLIREYTDFVAEQTSNPTGNGIDYYLINKNEIYDDELIYNHSAMLEVSGIRLETKNTSINKRLKEKLDRLEKYNHDFSIPTYIVIVEFGKPYTRVYGLSI